MASTACVCVLCVSVKCEASTCTRTEASTWIYQHTDRMRRECVWDGTKTKPPNGVSDALKVKLESYTNRMEEIRRFRFGYCCSDVQLACFISINGATIEYRLIAIPGQAFSNPFKCFIDVTMHDCPSMSNSRIRGFGVHDWTKYFANFDDIELRNFISETIEAVTLTTAVISSKNEIHQNDSCVYIYIQMDRSGRPASGEYTMLIHYRKKMWFESHGKRKTYI